MNENQKAYTPSVDSQKIRSNEDSIEWIESTHPDRVNGVALVIHGLNFQPGKMESIIALLTHSCTDVLNLSLRGHGKNYDQKANLDDNKARMATFKAISYEYWIKETHRAYDLARRRSREKQVPLFLIGFSLGGLMGATLFASYPDVYFSRMVLLAPALHIYKIYYLAKSLSPFPRLVIPSFFIKSYCSNRGTPVAAYNALFEAIEHLNKNMAQKLNVPALIIIDKQDELVSYRRLKRIIKNGGLDQWKLHPVKKNTATAKEKMHHLIIDESSLGKDAWNKMRGLIIHHLLA
ncbi:MAG: alpha/beta fold hydrolase [Deltaproteobacteria bacterium]|nr:alpha/beta fold hydrolase [Deltaproteobacteria bacterium]